MNLTYKSKQSYMFTFRSVFTPPMPVAVSIEQTNTCTEMLLFCCIGRTNFFLFEKEESTISLSAQYVKNIIFIPLAETTLFYNAEVGYFPFSVNVQTYDS